MATGKPTSQMTLVFTLVSLLVLHISREVLSEEENSIGCSKIPCRIASNSCPSWHYCNSHTRYCDPCAKCRDVSDGDRAPPANCKYPTLCTDHLYANQDYTCHRLSIAEGYRCSGVCSPCEGANGSYLGTTCQVECENGDEVTFSCIFLNYVAQWNFTRKPHWFRYDAIAHPPLPSATATAETVDSFETSDLLTSVQPEVVVAIVAGTVLGVVVVFVLPVVVCIVRRNRRRKRYSHQTEMEQRKELIGESPNVVPVSGKSKSGPEPTENEEPVTDLTWTQSNLPPKRSPSGKTDHSSANDLDIHSYADGSYRNLRRGHPELFKEPTGHGVDVTSTTGDSGIPSAGTRVHPASAAGD